MSKAGSKRPRKTLPGTHWREALFDERLAHMVKDAYRGLSRSLQARLRTHSVLYGHWTFLRILWQTDGLTQRQLSEQAGVMEPTTFSALQAMEKLGYITREKMPNNRRQIRICLTPKGAALRDLLVPAAEEINRIAMTGIPDDDIAATRRTLVAMVENLAYAEYAASRLEDDAPARTAEPSPASRKASAT